MCYGWCVCACFDTSPGWCFRERLHSQTLDQYRQMACHAFSPMPRNDTLQEIDLEDRRMIDRWLETRPTQTPLHLTKETLHLRNFTTLARLVLSWISQNTLCRIPRPTMQFNSTWKSFSSVSNETKCKSWKKEFTENC